MAANKKIVSASRPTARTQQELADAARIGVATVRLFEGNVAESRHATLAVLRRALSRPALRTAAVLELGFESVSGPSR
jgi:hypothetical protein